jgi:hypothetical protein
VEVVTIEDEIDDGLLEAAEVNVEVSFDEPEKELVNLLMGREEMLEMHEVGAIEPLTKLEMGVE